MKKPDRKPDFNISGTVNEFWMYPEMVWSYKAGKYNDVSHDLIEENNSLYCIIRSKPEKLWPAVQEAYREYKKQLDAKIDNILLDADGTT